jgi:DNA primase
MKGKWVDFKELRSKLHFAELFAHYHVELKIKGDRATGFCPLPGHRRHVGKRHSPSFSANLTKGIFQCFGCGAKGNVLDFTAYMEGVDPGNATALRAIALKVQERLNLSTGDHKPTTADVSAKPTAQMLVVSPKSELTAGSAEKKRVVNVPIDFELKNLDAAHPYLLSRGLTPKTIAHFGLGFCAKGLMADRIAIPLHAATKLIGYAGRLVLDANINDQNPKYRFPGVRERNGVIYEFRKSLFLYNGHGITAPVEDMVVVEGFPSVWWLWQHDYPNVVAAMGSSCSPEQAHLICDLVTEGGRVWVIADGDEAGERFAQSVLLQVSLYRFCRRVKLADGLQPTDLNELQLSLLFEPSH